MLSVRSVSVLVSTVNGSAASGEQFTALNSTLAWGTGDYSDQGLCALARCVTDVADTALLLLQT